MKAKKSDTKELPEEFSINSELNGKYSDQPLFKDKVARANHIIKTFKLPDLSKFKS